MTAARKRISIRLMRESYAIARAPIGVLIEKLGRLNPPADLLVAADGSPLTFRQSDKFLSKKKSPGGIHLPTITDFSNLAHKTYRFIRARRHFSLIRMRNTENVVNAYDSFIDQNIASDFDDYALRITALLNERLGDQIFQSLFGTLTFDELVDDVVRVSVPTEFLRYWIATHYRETLTDCCRAVVPAARTVEVTVRAGLPIATARDRAPSEIPRPARMEGSPLDPQRTLDAFIIAPSNRQAHEVAMGVVKNAREPAGERKPIFIHGLRGAGKSHLLNGIAWETQRRNPKARVLYLTAERFRSEFVASVRRQQPMDFIQTAAAADILMIDDLEFLYGEQSIKAFNHIAELITSVGHQFVVTSQSSLPDLAHFSENLRRRLLDGYIAGVEPRDSVPMANTWPDTESIIRELSFEADLKGYQGGNFHPYHMFFFSPCLPDRTVIAHNPRPLRGTALKERSIGELIAAQNTIINSIKSLLLLHARRKTDAQPEWRDFRPETLVFPTGGRLQLKPRRNPASIQSLVGFLKAIREKVRRWSLPSSSAGTLMRDVQRSLRSDLPLDAPGALRDAGPAAAPDKRPRFGLLSEIDDGALELEVFEVAGVIKWFDPAKGYGFISPDRALPDILLHVTCLRAGGYQDAPEGARVRCLVLKRPKGLQAFRVLGMDTSTRVEQPAILRTAIEIPEPWCGWEPATVKWFNRVRGFGFLARAADDAEVFVHMETIRRCGMTELRPGQAVQVRWGNGVKGRTAAEVRPLVPEPKVRTEEQ